jgi:hypothetical protein
MPHVQRASCGPRLSLICLKASSYADLRPHSMLFKASYEALPTAAVGRITRVIRIKKHVLLTDITEITVISVISV